jgi:parvulin-like peptidyl-prolyl isomerase
MLYMKLFGLLSLALSVSPLLVATDPTTVEEIVAKVNGDIITRGDLLKSRDELAAALKQRGVTGAALQTAYNEAVKDILRDRIDQLLLVQKGKDLSINVDGEFSKYMGELQKQSGIADPEKFQDYVKQQTGVPFEDWRQETKNTMLTQRVIRQEVGGKMNVKREEMAKYYNEHKNEFVREERLYLREILISTEKKDPAGVAAAEAKAKDLVARARKGERFPEMARDNSDAVTAKNMGELGGFKKGELNPTIENLVWSQPKGYITDPVRVDAGFEIFRVEEHQKAGQAEMADVENEIMEKISMPKMQPAVREFLTKLRESAFLEIKADYVDSGAAPGKSTAWADPGTLKAETITKKEVASKTHMKKLLWAVPVPGTSTDDATTSSSSKK